MNRLFPTLFAVLLSSTPILAGSESENESDWLSLDHEIESLANKVAGQGAGDFIVGGYVRTSFASSSDLMIPPSGNDLSGFFLDNVRFYFDGQVGEYGLYLQFEASGATGGGTATLIDAYAYNQFHEYVQGTFGLFKVPLVWSGLVEPNRLLFIPPTTSGSIWGGGVIKPRELGAQFDGRLDRVRWVVAYQNGADGAGDENRLTGRVDIHVLGQDYAERRMVEGALDAPQDLNIVVGLAATNDEALGDGNGYAADIRATIDRFFFHGEWISNPQDPALGFNSDNEPVSATASYMIVPDKYEIAIRYEDLDDVFNTETFFLGINRYIEGHDAKFQLNYADVQADAPSRDTQTVSIGVTVGV